MYKVQVNIDYKWTYALVDDWTADAVVTSVWSNLRLKFPSCAGLWLSGPDAYNGDRGEKKKNENIIDTNTHPDRIRYRCLVLRLKCVPCLLVVLGDGSKDLPSHMPRLALSLAIAETIALFSFLGLSVNIFINVLNSQPECWPNNIFDVWFENELLRIWM